MVMNGPDKHPGAVAVEDEFGRVISLATFNHPVGAGTVVLGYGSAGREAGGEVVEGSGVVCQLPRVLGSRPMSCG